jgi:hypothetical protein
MLKRLAVVVGSAAALALGASAALSHGTVHRPAPQAEAAARAGSLEGQEEDQVTAARLEALARGVFGAAPRPTTRPATGGSARGS